MSNIDNLHANDLEMAQEADWADGLTVRAATIAARRQHIADMAPCQYCRWPMKACRNLAEAHAERHPDDPMRYADLCGNHAGYCFHREDPKMLRALLDEIEAGGPIRTIAEVDPPPVQGPQRASMQWLLNQSEWWYPQGRPPMRITQMDKPHRWNIARWLERRAPVLEAADQLRGIWAEAPDDVHAALDRRTPQEFLSETPLYLALTRDLPRVDSRKGRLLAARAVHWNTCPMRKAHPAPSAHCTCIREGGRIVGATNDPAVTA